MSTTKCEVPRERRQTFSPVPVRLRSCEFALFAQSPLEPMDERTVPREEKSREMDLRTEASRQRKRLGPREGGVGESAPVD